MDRGGVGGVKREGGGGVQKAGKERSDTVCKNNAAALFGKVDCKLNGGEL